ncbi:hypothetical protein JAAARDRAFT_56054 [Jaapia argillacea MUCL 33604]|uniref:Uncharacterized protein n=1 Tax=Jaapia argillacea MUCL 33604 TaxID=933084 RepID=A0A067PZC8_9AGAM|nr:hypothetical protein JAAARDRAFT_56054 [Jaapia argillacea MUCL 33604]
MAAKRRLSMSMDDLSRRIGEIEASQKKGLMSGAFGSWLEAEWDYQKHMLPGVDNMWFLLERGTDFNPVCAGIYTFKEEIDLKVITRSWKAMTDRYPIYRQKVTGLGRRFHTARLRDDPDFDVRKAVRVIHMKDGKNGKADLEDEMARFVAQEWDLSRPLWEVEMLYNYRDDTGAKCALITRAHHALSDGQGFIMSQLFTTSARPMIEQKLNGVAKKVNNLENGKAKISDLPVNGLGKRLQPLDPFIPSLVVTFIFWALWILFTCVRILYDVYAATRYGIMFLTFHRRGLRYDGPRPEEREFSFSEAVSLQDIKVIQKAFQSSKRRITLNDVMCAVVVKTVGEYFDSIGETKDKRISFFIPISIRTPSDSRMKNLSTGGTTFFNAHPQSTQDLIYSCHDEMQKLKTAFWPIIAFQFLEWVYRIPVLFPGSASLVEWVLSSFHGVLTNVPGPPMPIDIDGVEILRWAASPPQAGKGTLGLGMISYNGHLIWTVTADKTPHHEGIARKLTAGFRQTFVEFLAEARALEDKKIIGDGVNGAVNGAGKVHDD